MHQLSDEKRGCQATVNVTCSVCALMPPPHCLAGLLSIHRWRRKQAACCCACTRAAPTSDREGSAAEGEAIDRALALGDRSASRVARRRKVRGRLSSIQKQSPSDNRSRAHSYVAQVLQGRSLLTQCCPISDSSHSYLDSTP